MSEEDKKPKVTITESGWVPRPEGNLCWHDDGELYVHTAEGEELRLTSGGVFEVKGAKIDV